MTHSTNLNELGQELGEAVPDWQPPVFPSRTTLTGQWCALEPLDPAAHAADLYAAYEHDTEGRLWTYLPYGPFASADEYREWVDKTCLSSDPLFYAIVDHDTGKATGVASYLRIAPAAGSIEVGHLCYSPALQQTRAATEAMYLMMKHAFDLGYRRYEWKCNALNAASRGSAQRLGFSFEGVFRQANVLKGRNRDTAWFSVIDGEWPALEQAYIQWLDAANFDTSGRQQTRLSQLTGPLLAQVDTTPSVNKARSA